jgi:hypothetical protein
LGWDKEYWFIEEIKSWDKIVEIYCSPLLEFIEEINEYEDTIEMYGFFSTDKWLIK